MPLSDQDRDMMIRTVIGEAGDQSSDGQAAVANVIMNRVKDGSWGSTPSDVVLSRGQFEPWQTRARELNGISPRSSQYKAVGQIVDSVASGATPDNTLGATHFLDPNIVKARRGGTLPDWAQGPSVSIGDHAFFQPGNPNYGDGGVAAINAAIGPPPAAPVKATAYTDQPTSSSPAAPVGSLFRSAGFDVPGATAAAPAAPAASPAPAPGALFKAAGFDLPSAQPQPAAATPASPLPPGAAGSVSVPGSGPVYVDAQGKFIAQPDAAAPAKPMLQQLREGTDPATLAESKAADIWQSTKDAFNASVGMAQSGASDLANRQYYPSFPSSDPKTWGAGGLLKTGAGVLGALTSPASGAINALVTQPVTNFTGNPGVGENAGLIASLAVPGPKVVSSAKGLVPANKALNTLVDSIGAENVPAAVSRLQSNPRLTLMDVSDPVRTLAQGLIDPAQPQAQNIITSAVKNRIATAPAAVDEAYTSAMGPAPKVLDMVEGLKKKAQDVGQKIIQPALTNAGPVDTSGVISAIDKELKPGITALANPGLNTTPSSLQQELMGFRNKLVDENGSQITDPVKLHQIQSDLRQRASQLSTSSTGSDRLLGNDLYGVRNQLVDAIDTASGGAYKPGLSKYRDAKMVDEAFRDGFDVTKNRPGFVGATEDSPDAMADWLLKASPEEIAAKQLGARASVAQDMGRTRFAARTGANLPDIDYNQQKLRMLFGSNEANRLIQNMSDIRDEAATNTKILQNSKTAETLAGQKALEVPKVEPFQLGSLTQALMPSALAEMGAEYMGAPPGLTGIGMMATGAALGGARKVTQSLSKQSALARNVAIARAASATGPARQQTMGALMSHPKVIRALQKSGNALTVP